MKKEIIFLIIGIILLLAAIGMLLFPAFGWEKVSPVVIAIVAFLTGVSFVISATISVVPEIEEDAMLEVVESLLGKEYRTIFEEEFRKAKSK